MAKSLWSGSISFGLLNIPVKLYNAVRTKEVHFRLLHEKDKVPLKQKLYCPADKKEVSRDEAAKGFQLSKSELVVLEDKEIESLMPKASHEIELIDFVSLPSVDPVFFQRPYYLVPEERSAKAYYLFLRAMRETKKTGIGTLIMRNKQYLTALRPLESVICLETMYFQDEIVLPEHLEELPKKVAEPSARELKMAEELIGALSKNFKPGKYHDEYRAAMMELIKKKAKGKKIILPETPEKGPKVIDLMTALEASLRDAKKKELKHAA